MISGCSRSACESGQPPAVALNDTGSAATSMYFKVLLTEYSSRLALEESPAEVEAFFTTADNGLADRLDALADRIAGESNSLLINRSQTLASQIQSNSERVDTMNSRLEVERERLLAKFYATEEAIGRIQADQSVVSSIGPISIPS